MTRNPHRAFRRKSWQAFRRCTACGHVARSVADQLSHADSFEVVPTGGPR